MTQIILLALSLGVLVAFFFWAKTFWKFNPTQGERYMIGFFGLHLFEVRLGDPNVRWYQRLAFYILFWPFGLIPFGYEWKQEMTYSDYLRRLRSAETKREETISYGGLKLKKGYEVSIDWEPEYAKAGTNLDGSTRESELADDGTPKDKSVKILVSRKEMMVSLRRTEGFALAAEFETKDGYRGYRMFTLFLEIENLSSVITEIRQWQTPAQLTFKSEYNAWSKKVIYKTLRETTMNSLLTTELGADKTKSFIIEINAKIAKFGYKIGLIEAGSVYIDLVSRDLLEAQEAPQKAQYILTTAKVTAQTKEVNANADAKVITIAATAEATKVTTIGAATNTVLANRIKILKDLYDYQKDLIVAKYGSKGLENLRVYIEGNGQGTSSDIQKMIDTLVAFDIHEEKKEV